jgi:glycosyltransferase involved in cell wall biosynthesis
VGAFRAGSILDRAFHHFPQLGPPLAGAYSQAETLRNPDVIHAHYLTTGYLVGSVTRSPLVVSAYGFDVTVLPRRRLWRAVLPSLAERVGVVLVEGPFMRRTFIGLVNPDKMGGVFPLAAGLEAIPFRALRAPTDGVRLVCCGRLISKKGHELAIRAFASARHALPAGSRLDLIGDGPLRPRLEELVRALGLGDRVRFAGALSRRQYLHELSRADMLLAPSLTARNGDGEGGAPTTILDAQAAGVLTVASTHADIPYLVEHGVTGLLVPEGNAEALHVAILDAVAQRGGWNEIAQRARDQVERRHSDAVVASLLTDVYQQVLK